MFNGRPSVDTDHMEMVCKCPLKEKGPIHILDRGDVYYPQMGYFWIGGFMFATERAKRRFSNKALEPQRRVLGVALTNLWSCNLYNVTMTHIGKDRETGRTFECTDSCWVTPFRGRVLLTVLIRRVQRHVRAVLRRRMAVKWAAVMMCSHERLGGESMLSLLPVDILREKILAA